MLQWISRIRAIWLNKKTLHFTAVAVIALLAGIFAQRNEPLYAYVGPAGLLAGQWLYAGIAALALGTGCILRRSRERYLVWNKKGFRNSRLAFTLALWLTASLCFLMGFRVMHSISIGQLAGFWRLLGLPSLQWWNLTAWMFLLLPDVLDLAFCLWHNIPLRTWKTWIFIPARDLPPKEGQRWLAFSFSTKRTEEKSVYLRATNHYPAQWKLGECFQYFLIWYNRQFPKDPIRYIADYDYERSYRWIFYTKSFFGKRILDPDLSLMENRISENTIVIVERVPEYIPDPEKPVLLESKIQTNHENHAAAPIPVGQLG